MPPRSRGRRTRRRSAERRRALKDSRGARTRSRDDELAERAADNAALEAELEQLRAEVAAAQGRLTSASRDAHDYREAETRDLFIDLLLREAGWPLDEARDREFEVDGHAERAGHRLRRLRAVGRRRQAAGAGRGQAHEARPAVGQQQAKLYADCLERAVRPAAGHLLHQRLRALDLGRRALSAARGPGLLHEGRAGAADPAARRRASRWPRRRSTRRSSSGTTSTARSARVAEAFERDSSARRCWSWRPAPARRAR